MQEMLVGLSLPYVGNCFPLPGYLPARSRRGATGVRSGPDPLDDLGAGLGWGGAMLEVHGTPI
jgi:hypothetical protein